MTEHTDRPASQEARDNLAERWNADDLDQLPDLVAAPLWVRRYEAARAAGQLPPEILANAAAYNAMIGDGHTGRVRPWTRADVIA